MTPRDDSPRDRGLHPRAETLLRELRQNASPSAGDALCAQIVELTLALADSAARAYRYRGIDPDDLTQVARLGLMKAIRGYNPDSGHGFAAYASPTINGEIKRHFRDRGWLVRPPRALQELRARLVVGEEVLRTQLRRQPTTRELAVHLGVTPRAVCEARTAARGFVAESLTAPREGSRPIEPASAGDQYREIVDWESVRPALKTLTVRQRQILRMRFVDDLTQAQIAGRVGLSQMQVSRILSTCMIQLRQQIEAEPTPAARPPRTGQVRQKARQPDGSARPVPLRRRPFRPLVASGFDALAG